MVEPVPGFNSGVANLFILSKDIIVMEIENNHPNISLYALEFLSKYLFSRFYSHWGGPKVHYFFKINNSYFHS